MKDTRMTREGQDDIKRRSQEGCAYRDTAERGHGHQACKKSRDESTKVPRTFPSVARKMEDGQMARG